MDRHGPPPVSPAATSRAAAIGGWALTGLAAAALAADAAGKLFAPEVFVWGGLWLRDLRLRALIGGK